MRSILYNIIFALLANCPSISAEIDVRRSLNPSTLCTDLTAAGQDEIQTLPGLAEKPNFKHYSGFLKTSATHFFHYWFVTSQGNPCQDPLIFWFNGGPGCSSLGGILSENGPYLTNMDGKSLRRNPHSWNKKASVMYIESPVGVGYSYSLDGDSGLPNDNTTANENYEAVKQFFAKFPLFRALPVFITGESYAGIYEPMLVSRILDGQTEFPINLGMAIGNGYMSDRIDTDSLVRFAYSHGLVSETEWEGIERECCGGCADSCDLGSLVAGCRARVSEIIRFVWSGALNVYDLYRDCTHHPNSVRPNAIRRGILRAKAKFSNDTRIWELNDQLDGDVVMSDKGLHHVPRCLDGLRHLLRCLDGGHTVNYLNLPEVRKALHIPENLKGWDECDDYVTKIYMVQYSDMAPFVLKAVRAGVRVLLYYGDTDMACNFLLGQHFSAQLGLKLIEEKVPWHFGGQIAGFRTTYSDQFTFITVRGAGHMVPEWRPSEIEYAFSQFLNNQTI